MLYDDDTWDILINNLDSFDFLISRPTKYHRVSKLYHIVGSHLGFEVNRNFYTSLRYEIEMDYFYVDEDETKDFGFEEFFEQLPEDIKYKIIFHLDLFR